MSSNSNIHGSPSHYNAQIAGSHFAAKVLEESKLIKILGPDLSRGALVSRVGSVPTCSNFGLLALCCSPGLYTTTNMQF